MIDLESLPSIPIAERKSLPTVPAIYFAIDDTGAIQYIGRSRNTQ